MARARLSSLRLGRSDAERLLAALLLSLFVHLATWGGYELGKKFGWWQAIHLPAWLQKTAKKTPPLTPPPTAEPQIFVDVLQSDPEPPKKTIYYSDKNAHAANLDEDKNLNQPKLTGKQPDSHKTEDAPKFAKLQPSPPPQPQETPQPQPMVTAQPKTETSPFNKGDIKANKSTDVKTETEKNTPPQTTAPPPRPRTLNQVREQQHLPAQQMKQDGGTHRRLQASFDVKATPFGDYDRRLIEAVQQHWDDLLTNQRFAGDRTGRVQVHFRLTNDGTVGSVTIVSSSVGDLLSYLCQAAIEEAAPFGKWPEDMRQQIGKNFRDITFTFDYY